jgi:tetratricopeptide (TPR) repeat protein
MKTWHRTLVSAAIAWTSLASQASTQTQDCFNLLKAQDHARAAQVGRQAVLSEGQGGDAFLCLGVAQSKLGDLDNALKSLQQAERLFTSKSDLRVTYSHLGSVAFEKGVLQQAMNYHSRELGLARELAAYRSEPRAGAFRHFRHRARDTDGPRPHTAAASRWRSSCATGQSA